MDVDLQNLYDEVHYIRTRVDSLYDRLEGIMWKITAIGATAGAVSGLVGFLVGSKLL